MSLSARSSHRVRSVALALSLLSPALLSAQEIQQAGRPLADSAQVTDSAAAKAAEAAVKIPIRPPSIFSKKDLAITAGFTAGALALMPLDRSIAEWSRAPRQQENGALKGAMAGIERVYEAGPVVAGASLWALGLATRNRPVAEMGFHTLAAVAVNQQVTTVLKGAFGRTRPYAAGDSLSHDWNWGQGFSGGGERRSFPSGHTSNAFAFATVLSHEISQNWPKAGRIATPLLYAGAAGAAYARVYHDKHWASDVAVGAAIGIVSARSTLRFLHGRPNNWFDRLGLNASIVPDGRGGGTLAVSIPVP